MMTMLVLSMLTAEPVLPPLPACTEANLGQCVDPLKVKGTVCTKTLEGFVWVDRGGPCGMLDAANRDFDAPGRALLLDAGEIAPYQGVLLDEQEDVRRVRVLVRTTAELEKAKEGMLISKPVFVAIVLGSIALSAGVTAGVTVAAIRAQTR